MDHIEEARSQLEAVQRGEGAVAMIDAQCAIAHALIAIAERLESIDGNLGRIGFQMEEAAKGAKDRAEDEHLRRLFPDWDRG